MKIAEMLDAGGVTLPGPKCAQWREPTLKVLALGMPCTGTASLKRALEILGYSPVYHGEDAYATKPQNCGMWMDALDAKYNGSGPVYAKAEFDKLIGCSQAVSDIPAICFAQDLIEAYPDAKVILTVRDLEEWHRSAELIDQCLLSKTSFVIDIFRKVLHQQNHLVFATFKKSWQALFNGTFETDGRQRYEEHCSAILSSVPKDNLLIWTVEQGWAPLCDFLEKPRPNAPVPDMDDAALMRAGLDTIKDEMTAAVGQRFQHFVAYLLLASSFWCLMSWVLLE